jgi:vacuolar protein sorting-associated protein 35
MAKDKLPDVGSEYEGEGGTVLDSIEFVLQNFSEMNKLWVRLQHQGPVRERAKRERQRRALRQLVGANLVRLSNLVGLTLDLYRDEVLPRILEQVVNCKDVIAQEFLMDCIIQVFPDEFHLATLGTYLTAASQLHEKVNVKDILIALMNRLSTFAKSVQEGSAVEVADAKGRTGMEMFSDMFPLFNRHVAEITQQQPSMSLVDRIGLLVALVNFVSTVHADRIDYVDQVLQNASDLLSQNLNSNASTDPKLARATTELLTLPLASMGISFLQLTNYEPMLRFLAPADRRSVALTIAKAMLAARIKMTDVGTVDALFTLLLPLIKPSDDTEERYEIEQSQQLVAQLFHHIQAPDSDTQFKTMLSVRKIFGQGGTSRIEFTLPPVIYGAMKLAEQVFAADKARAADPENTPEMKIRPKRIFSFIHETIMVLVEPFPEQAVRLFMQAAAVADKCAYEAIAYEFVAQAFIAYETEIADSKAQLSAINYIVASLPHLVNFSQENYDTLATKASQHCSRYIVKADQARAMANCAHLHWPTAKNHPGRDEKKVLSRLKRAVSIARDLIGNHTHIFVELLDKYIYFYDKECPSIDIEIISTLAAYIVECLSANDGSPQSQIAATHYANTLQVLESKGMMPKTE